MHVREEDACAEFGSTVSSGRVMSKYSIELVGRVQRVVHIRVKQKSE